MRVIQDSFGSELSGAELLGDNRERKYEGVSFSSSALCPDPTTLRLNKPLRYRKTQSGARNPRSSGTFTAIETLEHRLEFIGLDRCPFIRNLNPHFAVVDRDGHNRLGVFFSVLRGVVQQVAHNLQHPLTVGIYLSRAVGMHNPNTHSAIGKSWF